MWLVCSHVVGGDAAHTSIDKRAVGFQLKGFLVYFQLYFGNCMNTGLRYSRKTSKIFLSRSGRED